MLGADERKKHSSLSFLTSTDIYFPLPQSTSSQDAPHQTEGGTSPEEAVPASTRLLPTGSHYCAALPQTHSR